MIKKFPSDFTVFDLNVFVLSYYLSRITLTTSCSGKKFKVDIAPSKLHSGNKIPVSLKT